MIQLIPAIDIIEGKCVRLTKGDYDTKKVYGDPIALAKEFEQFGYKRLHVVDLDGAKSKHVVNDAVLSAITKETSLIVDFGGGVKTEDDLKKAYDAGATLVTAGSIAVTNPELYIEWLGKYGAEHLILGADVRNGRVSINGWKEDSDVLLPQFLDRYMKAGNKNVLCTDINRDGMLGGTSVELYRSVMKAHPTCMLIASGGVSCMEDIEELDRNGIPAVVFGKAIYEGRIDLKELIRRFPADETKGGSSC